MDEVKKKHAFRFRTNTSLLFFAKATSMEWRKNKIGGRLTPRDKQFKNLSYELSREKRWYLKRYGRKAFVRWKKTNTLAC